MLSWCAYCTGVFLSTEEGVHNTLLGVKDLFVFSTQRLTSDFENVIPHNAVVQIKHHIVLQKYILSYLICCIKKIFLKILLCTAEGVKKNSR